MGALSPWHVILLLAIALLVLGPGKLPETGAALGKAIRSFQDAASGRDESTSGSSSGVPSAPPPTGLTPPPLVPTGSGVQIGAAAPAGSPSQAGAAATSSTTPPPSDTPLA